MAKSCGSITEKLHAASRDYEDDVCSDAGSLANEVDNMRLVLKAMESILEVQQSTWSKENLSLQAALTSTMRNLKQFLEKLNTTLEKIRLDGFDWETMRDVAQAAQIRVELGKDKVDIYRQHIQQHHMCLQSALCLLQIHVMSQMSYPNIRKLRDFAEFMNLQIPSWSQSDKICRT